MKRLHDYLECSRIRVTTVSGQTLEGVPFDVNYADESNSGEDEIIIFVDKKGYCLAQSEIEAISSLGENKP